MHFPRYPSFLIFGKITIMFGQNVIILDIWDTGSEIININWLNSPWKINDLHNLTVTKDKLRVIEAQKNIAASLTLLPQITTIIDCNDLYTINSDIFL